MNIRHVLLRYDQGMPIGRWRIGGKRDGVLRVHPRAVSHLNGAEGTGVHEAQDSIWHAASIESLPVRLAVRTRTGAIASPLCPPSCSTARFGIPGTVSCPRNRLEKTGAAKGFTAVST